MLRLPAKLLVRPQLTPPNSAPFTHQEIILKDALGLGDEVTINLSGGALCGNPMFASGLIRIGEAAKRIWAGDSDRALGHATSGPALQQKPRLRHGRSLKWVSNSLP
ncbi:MAG: hypothetical protein R2709_02710 [Marmoricola sp.]